MPQKLGKPYKLSGIKYAFFKNKYGEVKCRNQRCHDPIKIGDMVVTRSNKNNGTNTLRIYHEKCAKELNII